MYHKFADTMLPGRKARRIWAVFLTYLLLPGLSMNIPAAESGRLTIASGTELDAHRAPAGCAPGMGRITRQAENYSLKQETPGINNQVRLARGVLLVAQESMVDPNFSNTVLLITEYEDTGTVGLVLNRPLENPAVEILPQLQELGLDSYNLYLGGPVRLNSLRLLVQAEAGLDDYYRVVGNIFQVTDLRGVQNLLKQEKGQFRIRLYAGYAGWFPGQLERELLRGGWHLYRSDTSLVFTDDPASLWERLIEQMDMQWVELNRD